MYVHFLPVLHSSHYGAVYRSTKVCGIDELQPGWFGLAYKQIFARSSENYESDLFSLKKCLKKPQNSEESYRKISARTETFILSPRPAHVSSCSFGSSFRKTENS